MGSTVEDLPAKFASLQLRDEPATAAAVLSGSTLRKTNRAQLAPARLAQRPGPRIRHSPGRRPGAGRPWRQHLRVPDTDSGRPADKMAVIVLTNADDGDPGRYVDVQAFSILWAPRSAAPRKNGKRPPPPIQRGHVDVGRYGREDADNESRIARS